MNSQPRRRWLGPTVMLLGVFLIGFGIVGILRASFLRHASWAVVVLPLVEVALGTVMLFVPLFRRLAREADEDDLEG